MVEKKQKQLNSQVEEQELFERVVKINRLAKVVTGGRRFSFSAIVVVGDKKGRVGVGLGKAKQVPDAIRKGKEKAIKNMVKIPVVKGTIPHEIVGKHDAVRVLLKPAAPGTGIIASNVVRAICELAGIENILTKIISRSSNPHNVAYATIDGLTRIKTVEEYAKLRDLSIPEMLGLDSKKSNEKEDK